MHRPVRAEVPPSRGSSGETGDAARSERLPMEATGGIRPIVGPDRSGRCQRRSDWPIETPAKAGAALAKASLISTFTPAARSSFISASARKNGVKGKRVYVRVDLGGRGCIKKKKRK